LIVYILIKKNHKSQFVDYLTTAQLM